MDRLTDLMGVSKGDCDFLVGRIKWACAGPTMDPRAVIGTIINQNLAFAGHCSGCVNRVGISLSTGV